MSEPALESALAGRDARRTPPRRGVVVLAVAGSIAVVLVVILLAFSLARGHRVVSGARLQLTSIHWVLTQVSHNGGPPTGIPASYGAALEFDRAGTAVANDGVNAIDADFTATATAITLRNTLHGAVGYLGGDPVLDITTGSLGDLFDYQRHASYTITGRVLTIQTPSWTLTFANAGPLQGPTGTPAPTAT